MVHSGGSVHPDRKTGIGVKGNRRLCPPSGVRYQIPGAIAARLPSSRAVALRLRLSLEGEPPLRSRFVEL